MLSFLGILALENIMSKLPKENQFVDLSDYGRPIAKYIANLLKNSSITPIDITISFIISGLLAIFCILNYQYWAAAFFLVLKSILDAADGELARIKSAPSYTGRYFDSIADILLNLLIVLAIWHVYQSTILQAVLAFLGIQLQGTLYNYYYVILRNRHNGDTTSRVFEKEAPKALKGEKQRTVNRLFKIYHICYGTFDRVIYWLDRRAAENGRFPNWFMTAISSFGLGFQLLIIAVMLLLDAGHLIIPFFIGYSFLIFIFIGLRKSITQLRHQPM